MLPAPMLSTIKFALTDIVAIIGAIKPAVVIPETVEEPTQTRIIAAIPHPKT